MSEKPQGMWLTRWTGEIGTKEQYVLKIHRVKGFGHAFSEQEVLALGLRPLPVGQIRRIVASCVNKDGEREPDDACPMFCQGMA